MLSSEGSTSEGSTIDDAATSEGSTTGPWSECGNGEIEDGEECDGTNWQGATCESLGHFPGGLACSTACRFDISGCVPAGMVVVPGGEFTMGSSRLVTLDAFWIDQQEVTVAEYTTCVGAGACALPSTGLRYNYGVRGAESLPINGVPWTSARAYCHWVAGGTKRLPTEAEWEKTAAGTDGRRYPWGNAPHPSCMHVVMSEDGNGCGSESTWAVGSKPLGVSPYGAMDMAGNVREWVSDWYGPYDEDELDDPTGPTSGNSRVIRGGSWMSVDPGSFEVTFRSHLNPTIADFSTGFRCARTPPGAG